MDNQHQHIKGYRDLSQTEIDLMNKIKAHGETTKALLADVKTHIAMQSDNAQLGSNIDEQARLQAAEPGRWLSIGRTHLQEGYMALVRAVAQPGGF